MIDEIKLFGSCLSPLRVFNKNTREFMFAPCGHCSACLNSKAVKQTMRVKEEIESHKFSYFFTLTYNNEYLPRFELIQDNNGVMQARPVGRCEYMFDSCPLNRVLEDGSYLFDEFTIPPHINGESDSLDYGVCCKKDIQNFLKRLRHNINKYISNEETKKVRYYICSEYGPTTFRPHYHGIIFFDNEDLSSKIKSLIALSWSEKRRLPGGANKFKSRSFATFSRTYDEVKACDANTAYYVADYITSTSSLPVLLRQRSCNTFHLGSKNPIIGSWKDISKEVLGCIERGTYETIVPQTDKQTGCIEFVPVPLPEDVCCSLFRKCQGFHALTDAAKRVVYSFYAKHYQEWQEYVDCCVKYNSSKYNLNYYECYKKLRKEDAMLDYRCYLRHMHRSDYTRYKFDEDATYYASRNCFRVIRLYLACPSTPVADYFRYVDEYLYLFDRLEYLRSQYRLKNFYTLLDRSINEVGYDVSLPFFYNVVQGDFSFNYTDDVNLLLRNSFSLPNDPVTHYVVHDYFGTDYYKRCVSHSDEKIRKKVKQKKINNTEIFGVRKID